MRIYLEEPVAQKLPDAAEVTIDRNHYYRQFLHGYYQFDCVVSKEITRSAKFYIPEGSIYNQPTVMIGVPDRVNTWEFMVKSGWKALADRYGLYLVMMEPENGIWGDPEKEKEYLDALNNDLALRPLFCAFQASFYGVGYGEAADIIGYQSRRMARAYAAVALLGTRGMTEEEQKAMSETMTRVPGVACSEVQWPVWLAYEEENEAVRREIAYYKKANHSRETGAVSGTCTVYEPEEGGDMDEHWCANVAADRTPWEACVNEAYSERILTELFDGIYRYPGNNNGALRKYGNIYERGFEKFTADIWGGYYPDRRDTYRREWYVYVPESARGKENVPCVFVYHGAGGSGDEIADRIGWSDVADRHGLILIMPTASEPNEVRDVSDIRTNNIFRAMWNCGSPQPERPDDFLFIDYLYKWVTEKYPIDKTRVYASGQSSGGMMSWSSAAYRPGYFAAVAPFSARDFDYEAVSRGLPENPPVEGALIGITANLAENDAAFPGGFRQGQKMTDYWCERYHLTKRWSDYTYMDGAKNCSFKEGALTHYVFETTDGVPLLHLTETDVKAHAAFPSECEMAWTTFLSKYAKNPETGQLYYEGKEVWGADGE